MDHNLTIKIKQWLEAESHTEPADIIAGATMLLQLNRNQAMFNTILRNPERYVDKIVYELGKFLPMRLNGMTTADTVQLETDLTPQLASAIATEEKAIEEAPEGADTSDIQPLRSGKREDHDSLPEEIQVIWPENAARWKKIKALYNSLLQMESQAPCDRYELLYQLKEAWYKYKQEFDRYDSFINPQTANNGEPKTPAEIAADIANAQKYLSGQVAKLIKLHSEAMADDASEKAIGAYQSHLQKMNKRLLTLTVNNVEISEALSAKLIEGGMTLVHERPFDPDFDSIG